MDAARELAQLLQRLRRARRSADVTSCSARPGSVRMWRWIIRSCSATDDEPLLRAVVEVALEPPPLGVAGGDDALARGAQLGEPVLGLGLQPRVVERDRGRGGDGLDELRIVVERRVVDEHPRARGRRARSACRAVAPDRRQLHRLSAASM